MEEEGGAFILRTVPLLDALDLIRAWAPSVAVACCEDSRHLPVYSRHKSVKGPQRDRLARSIGRVDGATSTLIEHLRRLGIPVVLRSPEHRRKLDAEGFRRLTRFPGVTDQHQRDAAFLVYGYTASALLREAERQGHAAPPVPA
jgi:hypothetical protein